MQWGDSITALMRDAKRDVWDAVWEDTGLLTQPLGMGGSTVEVSGLLRRRAGACSARK